MKIHRLVFLLAWGGVALHSDAYAAPTLQNCYSGGSKNNPFDSGASCGGMCDWVQQPNSDWAIVCDLDDVCTGDNLNSIEAVENNHTSGYGDDDIVIFGQCDQLGSPHTYCCMYEDTLLEVENIILYGTPDSDYMAFRDHSGQAQLKQLSASGAPKINAWAYALAGHDRLRGSNWNGATQYQEHLYGGDDIDYVIGVGGPDIINSGNHTDFIEAGAHDDNINGGGGDNVVVGGTGHDVITTGSDDDYICAATADDIPHGVEYNWNETGTFVPAGALTTDPNSWGVVCDTTGSDDNDTVNAGNGNNRVHSGSGVDNIETGTGADEICLDGYNATGAKDVVVSGRNSDNNDVVYFWAGSPNADVDCGAGNSDNASGTSGTRVSCELSTVSACPF